MGVHRLSGINGKMVTWAREVAGYDIDDVARLCGFSDPQAVVDVEADSLKPTLRQAEQMADLFKRPTAIFYLTQVPKPQTKKDNDNRSSGLATSFTAPTKLAVRKFNLLQEYESELQEIYGTPKPVLPQLTTNTDPTIAASALRKYLGIEDLTKWLYRAAALEDLIKSVEAKNIVVSQQPMPRSELQGMSSYKPWPAILLNHSDYTSSKIFTLIHELCHLGLRSGGYCLIETSPSHNIERYCNSVAGETLVPSKTLASVIGNEDPYNENTIQALADHFCVSREVILLRLIHNGIVGEETWDKKTTVWRQEYLKLLKKKHLRRATPVTRALRENGHGFTQLVTKSFYDGRISSSEASRYLNIKGGIFEDVQKRV